MGYFRELPNIRYQSFLNHKKSTKDFVDIKNIFRRTKLFDYLSNNVSLFNKYVIEDGDRPDTIAESLYNNAEFDYIVVLVAGITNITHQWPLQDFQMYDFALAKYGSEENMNAVHHYETYEIKDSENRLILPPNLIVDSSFKIDGSALRFGTNRFTLISQAGNTQLDDKNEYTVATDNIARPVTNYEYETIKNDESRKIDVLRNSYLTTFVDDFKEVIRYSKNSHYMKGAIAKTENTNIIP
jgi:hypothetical protein